MTISPARDNDLMVLEGLLTTIAPDSRPHLAAMGPVVDRACTSFVLKPFETSQTYQHLRARGVAVFHVTDDVLLIARVLASELASLPAHRQAEGIEGVILEQCCRWYALRVREWEGSSPRWIARCEVVDQGEERPFWGFNRAMHAVIEAAILASRVGILPSAEILDQLQRLRPLVDKTGGERERDAFAILGRVVLAKLCSEPATNETEHH
ncbi:protein of unknown function DUF447 [Pirellula staleyi DSM 6068]|uniref:DUF447 family protein n=1 Tax=Pirellula staleyi (strain ATCC 27377 / DSM 6068 / ICPB 4128) TaxID=530564 RepID=D2R6K0_PIRSD|nr:DUF447 domain-containing protein [Pirellula staleyi]ADB17300.1 protein of unknown function DUF447 [Pirellula staleyi DSM 6068]